MTTWTIWGDRGQRRTILCLLLMAGIMLSAEAVAIWFWL